MLPSYPTPAATVPAIQFSFMLFSIGQLFLFFKKSRHCRGTYSNVRYPQYMVNQVPFTECNYFASFCETSSLRNLYEILFCHITFEIFLMHQFWRASTFPLSSFVVYQVSFTYDQAAEWYIFFMNGKFWKAKNLAVP